MNPSTVRAAGPLTRNDAFVSSDFVALASHMTACQRSRGRFFTLQAGLETLQSLTAPRLVTTGALCVLCSSLVILALGLLRIA